MTLSFVEPGSVKEGLNFLARTIVQRTQPGLRQSVKTEGYLCHVHVKDFGLAGIVVADAEYPTTAAFSIINKVLDEFILQSGDSWQKVTADSKIADPILEPALIKYQVWGYEYHLGAMGYAWSLEPSI
jgi:synaptobrevin family protein YKT6